METSDSEAEDPKKKYKCSVPGCRAAFSKNRKLTIHNLKHTGERPFVCAEEGCGKSYTNNCHLLRHKRVNHSSKTELPDKVPCDFEGCTQILANKYSLKKHYNNKHNSEKITFKCDKCSKEFLRKRHLQFHSCDHSGIVFSCDKCTMTFNSLTLFTKHKTRHQSYTCDCGQVFYTWSLALAHKRLCRERVFTCDLCDKKFSQGTNLKNHKLSHIAKEDREVFACPYEDCDKFYFQKRNLNTHILSVHKKDKKSENVKCTYPNCNAVFKSQLYLRRHLQLHFKVNLNKPRNPRRDKGISKKSIVSLLVGKVPVITETQTEKTTLQSQEIVNTQIAAST